MQLVLDGPMGAGEIVQPFRASLGGWQAGDEVDNLGAVLAADPPGAFEPRGLGKPRPVQMRHGFGTNSYFSDLDPAVIFVGGLCLTQIRRQAVEAPARGRGGKDRRRLRRCQLSVLADCP